MRKLKSGLILDDKLKDQVKKVLKDDIIDCLDTDDYSVISDLIALLKLIDSAYVTDATKLGEIAREFDFINPSTVTSVKREIFNHLFESK